MKIAVVDDERPARKELISQILDVKNLESVPSIYRICFTYCKFAL